MEPRFFALISVKKTYEINGASVKQANARLAAGGGGDLSCFSRGMPVFFVVKLLYLRCFKSFSLWGSRIFEQD